MKKIKFKINILSNRINKNKNNKNNKISLNKSLDKLLKNCNF